MDFPYDENSRISDILDAYPWLVQVLPDYDPRLKSLSNPAVRALTRKYTVTDVSKFTGYSTEKLLDKLRRLSAEHE